MQSIRVYITLMAVSVGILVALVASPATRWLVLPHLRYATGLSLLPPPMRYDTAYAAKTFPNEFEPQLYAAYRSARSDNSGNYAAATRNLRSLAEQYPAKPAVIAGILNAEANTNVNRPDLNVTILGQVAFASSPELLNDILHTSEAGERIAPDNAYFHMLCAASLYCLRRDDGALAEMSRAARCTNWNAYTDDVLEGGLRLCGAQINAKAGRDSIAMVDMVNSPPYAILRAVGDMALAHARQLETAGRPAEALRIRYDVLKCGSLMRNGATSSTGILIGQAIEDRAVTVATLDATEDVHQTFERYLQSIGRQQDIPTVDAEFHVEVAESRMIRDGEKKDGLLPAARLEAISWITASCLWIAMCSLVIYCGIIRLCRRSLSQNRAAYAVGIILATGAAAATLRGTSHFVNIVSVLMTMELALLIGMRARKRGHFGGAELRAALLVGLAWGAALAHGIWQAVSIVRGFTGADTPISATIWDSSVICVVVGLPIVVGWAALIGRRTAPTGPSLPLVRGTIALATVMITLYGNCILRAESLDNVVSATVRTSSQNEAAYDAKLAGQTLPGPTDWSQLRY